MKKSKATAKQTPLATAGRSAKPSYALWLAKLKKEVTQVRLQTTFQVNKNMLLVYWYIGTQLNQKIDKENWGAKVIDKLSVDLQKAFPEMTGFSVRNLHYMKKFASSVDVFNAAQHHTKAATKTKKNQFVQTVSAQLDELPQDQFVQTLSAQIGDANIFKISWSHHILLMDKTSEEERVWYMQKTIENNWSVRVLQYQIATALYQRQAKNKKNTNFHLTLPKEQSDLANQIIKAPYKFEFLQISEETTEREMELQLVQHIQAFLLELGTGFAFVGRQYKLNIGKKDYIFDLLFYHLELRAYVIIELKLGAFEPGFVGQINAYINATNKLLRKKEDNPTIGIILCAEKDEIDVEFSIENIRHPIGVSNYHIASTLPKAYKNKIPTAKQWKETIKEFNKKLKK